MTLNKTKLPKEDVSFHLIFAIPKHSELKLVADKIREIKFSDSKFSRLF